MTSQTVSQQLPLIPVIPSGQEIYDSIMAEIEPELTSAERPRLREKYRNEAPEQSRERAKRYRAAFAEYKKRFTASMQALQTKVREYKREAMSTVENRTKSKEANALSSLEAAMSAA
jgi:hypothetical protein